MNKVLFLLLGLVSPLLLWPVEALLPFPYLIEEGAKYLAVWFLLGGVGSKNSPSWGWVACFGLLFTISESVFYLFNFWLLGDLTMLGMRIVLTGGLHILTTVVIFFTLKRGTGVSLVGLMTAMALHYLYNAQIMAFLLRP